jgi:hypothetical protein
MSIVTIIEEALTLAEAAEAVTEETLNNELTTEFALRTVRNIIALEVV